ncbi:MULTISPECIES: hypothetical protein [unclassified Agarivorans]|uniref:hypothetical protein n=1 Tax=unclassified Agarivorans TaxID=2636026 RepID=UPI003D7C84FB
MFRLSLRSLLLNLWHFSIVYSVVLISIGYCEVMQLDFEVVDQGINRHKWSIIGLYFLYLTFWWWLNPYFTRLRRSY